MLQSQVSFAEVWPHQADRPDEMGNGGKVDGLIRKIIIVGNEAKRITFSLPDVLDDDPQVGRRPKRVSSA